MREIGGGLEGVDGHPVDQSDGCGDGEVEFFKGAAAESTSARRADERVLRRRQEEHGGQAERALNQLRGRFHFVDDGEGERGENANEPPTTRLVQNDSL